MNFLDANVIAYAFYVNKHTRACQVSIRSGGMTDAFGLSEAFRIIEHESSRELAQKAIRGFLSSNIHVIDIDINIIFDSLKQINKSRMSICDMVHYTAAIKNGCTHVVSFDRDFDHLQIPRIEP